MSDNQWQPQSGTNPYRRTAFHVLDLAVDIQDPVTIKGRIDKRRLRAKRGAIEVDGRQLSEAEIVGAASAIDSLEGRIRQQLLVHRPHPLDTSGVKQVRALLGAEPPALPRHRLDLSGDWALALLPEVPRPDFEPVLPWPVQL